MPNRFLGVVGSHDGFPIQNLCLSSDGNVCASISHDESVKFWNVESIKNIKLDAQSKSENKSLKNKKITSQGKSENFFSDLVEKENEDEEDSDSSEEEENDSDSDDSDSESD